MDATSAAARPVSEYALTARGRGDYAIIAVGMPLRAQRVVSLEPERGESDIRLAPT